MIKKIPKPERLFCFFSKHPILFCFITSLITNLVVEILSRKSVIAGLLHVFTSFNVFLYNSLIIFTASLVCLFFRRRAFALTLLISPFIGLAIANCVVLSCRVTPLSAPDFVKITSIFGIFKLYIPIWGVILIIAAVIAIITMFVLIWKHSDKKERLIPNGIVLIPLFIIIIALFSKILIANGKLNKKFTNLNDAYHDYGFVYCFACSAFDTGIEKPENYSIEKIDSILNTINASETKSPDEKPNIIFVQLESFFDVNYINSLEYNENPVPFFTKLKENYPHGFLEVPYIGSGTANVEFEIMTGMSLEYFGPGEYPYKTILQTSTCESIAYNLKELGYTSHAVHNHNGSFYDRAHVFSNLGFDTFVSLEFMRNVSYNAIGWANDIVMADEIKNCLDFTDGSDFIYAITVQTHGVYSTEKLENVNYIFDVSTTSPTEVDEVAFEYYLTQLNDTDTLISALVSQLSEYDEKTVVVFFGDHLPYFGITNEELVNGNVYQTEYVIWSNYGIEAENTDLHSYELSAHVMKILGINNGLLTKLHQNLEKNEIYYEYLEMLQYDMLYGLKECYGYKNKYYPTELQMGVRPITVTNIISTYDGTEVEGTGFTEFTEIEINGEMYDTEYISENKIFVPDVDAVFGDVVIAAQTNGKSTVYRASEPFIAGEENEIKEIY